LFVVELDLKCLEHLPDEVELTIHDVTDKSNDGLHDELNEAAGKLATIAIITISGKLFFGWVEEIVTPELFHKLESVNLELISIDTSETSKSEGPTEESGTKSDGTVSWVNLLRLTHIITLVC
jgi:hypothetical protein